MKISIDFYVQFLRKMWLKYDQRPFMESECPYKDIGANFNLDFFRIYIQKHAETFTAVSSHKNLQIHTKYRRSIG